MRLIAPLLLALAAAPALAQQLPTEAPGKPDPARAVSGSYKLDPGHSQVVFTVTHFGFSDYIGQFREPTGTLVLDAKAPAKSKVDVTFQIAKVGTTVAALDAHLQKPEFFDAEKFPTATFVSTTITTHGNQALISGNLTIKGITKPVVLHARLVGAGINPFTKKPAVGFAATTTIRRSDFGVAYGIPLVTDKVDLTINAAFDAE
ncbi:YceI family protein [Sphingomonas sp. GlSt437]|uniref:YceI family protein n=1 Tax=Sphingomonas sp. GlSt437 TaxID=3389970 RepID=UPI003A8B8657